MEGRRLLQNTNAMAAAEEVSPASAPQRPASTDTGPRPSSHRMFIPRADITPVTTATDLQSVTLAGAQDIEVRGHVDLRGLARVNNPELRAPHDPENSDSNKFALLYALSELRSFRVRRWSCSCVLIAAGIWAFGHLGSRVATQWAKTPHASLVHTGNGSWVQCCMLADIGAAVLGVHLCGCISRCRWWFAQCRRVNPCISADATEPAGACAVGEGDVGYGRALPHAWPA